LGIYGLTCTGLHYRDQLKSEDFSLSADAVRALRWVKENTPKNTVLVAERYHLEDDYGKLRNGVIGADDFYLYAALTERQVTLSGSKYGSLLAALADVDTVKGLVQVEAATQKLSELHMASHSVFTSSGQDRREAMQALNAKYVIASRQSRDYTIEYPESMEDFEVLFRADELAILKLKD
jgi:hypothetical protein